MNNKVEKQLIPIPDVGMTREEVQEAIDWLEARGLLRKTGEYRWGTLGLQPVYVATELDRATITQEAFRDESDAPA